MRAKTCSRCDRIRALVHFHKQTRAKDGYQAWCVDCHRSYGQQKAIKANLRCEPAVAAKRCPKCGQFKKADCFHRRAVARDGLQSSCKECNNAAWRANAALKKQRAKLRGNG